MLDGKKSSDGEILTIGIDCRLNSNNVNDRSYKSKAKLSDYSQIAGVVATIEK
jgi:hypothetical protein